MKKNYNVGGQMVPGEEVEFEIERESFNTYILLDGTRIKFKSVVLKFVRLDQFTPDGDPIYISQATNVLVSDVPDSLQRK